MLSRFAGLACRIFQRVYLGLSSETLTPRGPRPYTPNQSREVHGYTDSKPPWALNSLSLMHPYESLAVPKGFMVELGGKDFMFAAWGSRSTTQRVPSTYMQGVHTRSNKVIPTIAKPQSILTNRSLWCFRLVASPEELSEQSRSHWA